MPGRERAICIFCAESLADITTVNERAGMPSTESSKQSTATPRRGMTDCCQPGALPHAATSTRAMYQVGVGGSPSRLRVQHRCLVRSSPPPQMSPQQLDSWLPSLERSSVRSLAFSSGPRAKKQRRLDALKQRTARMALWKGRQFLSVSATLKQKIIAPNAKNVRLEAPKLLPGNERTPP